MFSDTIKNSKRLLFFIILLGFFLRLTGSWFGYPWLTHYDEPGEITIGAFSILDFKTSHGIAPVTHNGPFCKYLLAFIFGLWALIGSIFTSMNSIIAYWKTTNFAFILGRMVVGVLFGTATIYAVYLTGKRIKGELVGLISAFLFAVAFKSVEFAHYATSDTVAVFMVACVFYFSLSYYEEKDLKFLRWAGIFWSAGVATKLSTVPSLIIPLIALFAGFSLKEKKWFKAFLHLFLSCLLSLLFFHLPYVTKPLEFVRLVLYTLLVQTFFFKKGFFWYFDPQIYPLTELPTAGIGWTLLAVCILGLVFSLFQKGAKKWILLAFPLVFYLILATARVKLMRYFLPIIPFLCIWGALVFDKVDYLLTKFWRRNSHYLVLIVLVLIFSFSNIYHSLIFSLQAADGNTVMELNRTLPTIITPHTIWTNFSMAPIRNPLPGKLINANFLNVEKDRYDRETMWQLRNRITSMETITTDSSLIPSGSFSLMDLLPDSLNAILGLEYLLVDKNILYMVHNLPDKYLWHPENFHKARNLLDYVVKNWELVKEFKPFYRQNWGEGVAGRQSVIYIYHYKGI